MKGGTRITLKAAAVAVPLAIIGGLFMAPLVGAQVALFATGWYAALGLFIMMQTVLNKLFSDV